MAMEDRLCRFSHWPSFAEEGQHFQILSTTASCKSGDGEGSKNPFCQRCRVHGYHTECRTALHGTHALRRLEKRIRWPKKCPSNEDRACLKKNSKKLSMVTHMSF